MNDAQKLTIQLIRYELFDVLPDDTSAIDEEMLQEIYLYAQEQDVVYIVASALSKLKLISGEIKTAFFNEQLGAIYRNEQFKNDLQSISSIFDENSIDYIPLKGAVIKQYYPKPEMRTSCDIDILIHRKDLENALELLYANGYEYVSKTSHDVMLSTSAGTYIELHFSLNEYEFKADEIMQDAWHYAEKCQGYRYDFTKEFFVFYHIAHIARHMYTGGCGIRPFVDFKIIEDSFEYDKDKLLNLLERANLKTFYTQMVTLVKMWFEGVTGTELAIELENYILSSGIYGKLENKIAVINDKNKDGKKYARSIIFPSRDAMTNKYPVLNKAPVLLPIMYVVRWISSVFTGSSKAAYRVLRASNKLTNKKQSEVVSLLNSLGL